MNLNKSLEIIHQLQQEFSLKKIPVDLGERTIEIFKVENIDDLLDRISDPEEIPFWAELWPSSIGLARNILKNKAQFKDKTVLELGSGVGLAGIAATLAGANVVHSDFIPKAFEFIELNCLHNGLTLNKTFLADWRNFPEVEEKFDRIIGGDILYEKTLHDDLIRVFEKALKKSGEVWLADPGRNYAKIFIEKLLNNSWQLWQNQTHLAYEERVYKIDIYRLQRLDADEGEEILKGTLSGN